MLPKSDILQIINDKSRAYDLDNVLIQAIVQIESSYMEKAMKYEMGFTYYYSDLYFAKFFHIDQNTERALQRFSYGLMQVMGGTARAYGFTGFLTDLLDPQTNLEYGCKFFASLVKRYKYTNDQIAAYNAGSVKKNQDGTYVNQKYVDKVLGAVEQILAKNYRDSYHL